MTAADPLLSVIISTHNRAALVGDALRSVLEQSADRLELIVVDDGSSDHTAEVVQAFGALVRYLRQDNAGPAAARNHGVRLARGAVLGFLDDDDLWAPGRLSLQLPHLLADPRLDGVLGRTQRMIRADRLHEHRSHEHGSHEHGSHVNRPFVVYREPVELYSLGCALFRRAAFDRVGPLDEKMRHAEDDDWFMRARALGLRMQFLPEVSLYYRFHDGNLSYDKREKQPYLLRLVKNRLDRIRKGEKS
jgi:glycosyltransferase involved in cell wall biosynthesis